MNYYVVALSCYSNIRRTISIQHKDLPLPQDTIQMLEDSNASVVRLTLSDKLDKFNNKVTELQTRFHKLCMYISGTHFASDLVLDDIMSITSQCKSLQQNINKDLYDSYDEELARYRESYNKYLDSLPSITSLERDENVQSFESYFPSKQAYANCLQVLSVGPLPVPHPREFDTSSINIGARQTQAVLELAKQATESNAYNVLTQFYDSLDTKDKPESVNGHDTGKDIKSKRRGKWEIVAEELIAVSKNLPEFTDVATAAKDLLNCSRQMLLPKANKSLREDFKTIRENVIQEMQKICDKTNKGDAIDALRHSMMTSSHFNDLKDKVRDAQSQEDLAQCVIDCEHLLAVYESRNKEMTKLINRKMEVLSIDIKPVSAPVISPTLPKPVQQNLPLDPDF